MEDRGYKGSEGLQVAESSRTSQDRGQKSRHAAARLFCFSSLVLGGLSKTTGIDWSAQVK